MATQIPSAKLLDTDFMFTKLVVKDLDGAVEFYGKVVGLVELQRVQAEIMGRPVNEVVFLPTLPGGPMFILAQFDGTETPPKDELILGFSTKDISAFVARAEAAGGRLLEAAKEVPGSGGMQLAFVSDPEGHIIQLNQMPS